MKTPFFGVDMFHTMLIQDMFIRYGQLAVLKQLTRNVVRKNQEMPKN